MNFPTHDSLAGYARAAVDLRIRMVDYHRGDLAPRYLHAFLDHRTKRTTSDQRGTSGPGGGGRPVHAAAVDAMTRITATPWRVGEAYVVAPAMNAILAAAAQALDLAGDILTDDIAPSDHGVLFLPEPLYQRGPHGHVVSIGAITWTRVSTTGSARACWVIGGWADVHDPDDPSGVERRALIDAHPQRSARFGPYLLTDYAELPIAAPVPRRPDTPPPSQTADRTADRAADRTADRAVDPAVDEAERDWQPAPDGRYCLDDATTPTPVCAAIAYAFWRLQAQPLATVAPAPIDRAARRRAVRASIRHDTRVVMLRRTSPLLGRPDGEAKWHYRVRFLVRGHWRRLVDGDGNRYRVWVNSHIKGPDGAPLLHGEKVAILAR